MAEPCTVYVVWHDNRSGCKTRVERDFDDITWGDAHGITRTISGMELAVRMMKMFAEFDASIYHPGSYLCHAMDGLGLQDLMPSIYVRRDNQTVGHWYVTKEFIEQKTED